MSRRYRVLCGVPDIHCTGGRLVTDQILQTTKAHSSHEEAFNCHVRYLTRVLGYERIGGREFRPPPGVNKGYIRVLTKKSRFGGRMRAGKEGRFMPKDRGGGLIVG